MDAVKGEQRMKITMLTTMCGPNGNADPGSVLDLPKKDADDLIAGQFARQYDAEKDNNPRHVGLRRYVRGDE